MTVLTIYHNPRCSKSRTALKYLEENADGKYTVDTILYQKTGPTREQLEKLTKYLGLDKSKSNAPWEILLRPDAKKLVHSWEETYALLEQDANHLERPFVVDFENERAALGRPDLTDVEELVSRL